MNQNQLISLLVAMVAFSSDAMAQRTFETDILAETFGYGEGTTSAVDLDDLHQGCDARDCIPSIDDPKYVTADDATHVDDDDIVLAISLKGYNRAWPAQILDVHEIVNDIIAGMPVAITWCPLCGSAVGVRREIDGKVTEFGVSGLLYNSDLVFYDRRTNTLWDQIEAKGIVGPLTGTELELIPVTMTRWGRWKAAHPDTLVLSRDTGFDFDYGRDRYAAYRGSNNLMFPVAERDRTVPPKTVVFGFDIAGEKVAVTEERLHASTVVSHVISGKSFDIRLADDGMVTMSSADGETQFTPVRLYWFAWYTFHPGTALIR